MVNQRHPRMIIEKEPQPIPLCIDTGRLMSSSDKKIFGLDSLGMGISIYFKLLKSMVVFFILCCIIYSPLFYFYSCGEVSKQATGTLQMQLSEWTLGNIGESSYSCKQRNVKIFDTIDLWCPSGTLIRKLVNFGLQKNVTEEDNLNNCPQTITENGQDDNRLFLDLDVNCTLRGFYEHFPEHYTNFTKQF